MIFPASLIDHTLLRPEAGKEDIRRLCEEAVEYGFPAVCVAPVHLPLAVDVLYGSEVAAGTVVGFPLGYQSRDSKVFETTEAVSRGAAEIDMVIHYGAALEGDLKTVAAEICAVVEAARGARVKVILECCCLSDALKRTLSLMVAESGAAYVKTSTGFGSAGATEADVRLLSETVAGRIGVKAAGGIRDLVALQAMAQAGATRIGTSAGLLIMEQWRSLQEGGL